jgi:2-phospho-L-lactate guanylyltransferase
MPRPWIIIPLKTGRTVKSRLRRVLSPENRRKISQALFMHVLNSAVNSADAAEVVVVTSDQHARAEAYRQGAHVLHDEDQGVNSAVRKAGNYCVNHGAASTLVLPADLPLISPLDIKFMVNAASTRKAVVIVPSLRLDGTNALLRKPAEVVQTFFDQDSFKMHLKVSLSANIPTTLYLARSVRLDIDTPSDLRAYLESGAGDPLREELIELTKDDIRISKAQL